MHRIMRVIVSSALLFLPLGLLAADVDFSGNWTLDRQESNLRSLPATPAALLTISQQGNTVNCTEGGATWSFYLDGTDSKYRIKDSSMNTESKWEGRALLVNTLVGGPENYVIEDRWELSKDGTILTITRTVRRGAPGTAATLVYKNQERLDALRKASPAAPDAPPAPAPAKIVVAAGTKIPLALVNTLSTKRSGEGDRVYLETVFPITQNGCIVIPKGSYVAGTVTEVKRAGRVKGKAELFLRFDSLTLPNGVTRDFRSRLDSSDTGNVDRNEGKIEGEGNKAGDARTVGTAAGAGATIGGIAGSAAGHGVMGAGIGAAGGAAAGVAGVLLTRGPDLVLAKGTTFEMVLDRELRYEPRELQVQ
jgi:type IV secretion system protein VirB10